MSYELDLATHYREVHKRLSRPATEIQEASPEPSPSPQPQLKPNPERDWMPIATAINPLLPLGERIQRAVCCRFGITRDRLIGRQRNNGVMWARHMALTLTYRITGLPTTVIGRIFDNRDHSTVIHATQKVERSTNIALAAEMEYLRNAIEQKTPIVQRPLPRVGEFTTTRSPQ